MANIKLNNNNLDDDVDLKKILKSLLDSKKLIIVVTLAISLIFFIHSTLQDSVSKSTVLIEIGSYNSINGEEELIEPVSDLIRNLKVELLYKQKSNVQDELKFNSIEEELLQIKYSAPSEKFNKSFLEDTVAYIENRHSNLLAKINNSNKTDIIIQISDVNNEINFIKKSLANKKNSDKTKIISQISDVNTEINFIKKSLANKKNSDKKELIRKIEILNIKIPTFENKIKLLNQIIVQDKENISLLQSSPSLKLERAAQSPTLEQVVYSYSAEILNHTLEINKLTSDKNFLEAQLEVEEYGDLSDQKMFKLTQELSSLEAQLEVLENQSQNKTKLIDNIETNQEAYKIILITLFGIILGFVFSVVIIVIRQTFASEQN